MKGEIVRIVVTDKDEHVVSPGDEIVDFRGLRWLYRGCFHPRKITVERLRTNPTDIAPLEEREFFPSVFSLKILEQEDES